MTQSVKKKSYTRLSDSQLTWPHWVLQWICIQLVKLYANLLYTVIIQGKENIPEEWIPCVVAANHSSSLDPPLVSVALEYRPIAYMAKEELFVHPMMRFYNWMMSSFAVNREKLELSTIKTAHRVLKHGKWAIGIFPEGTRSGDSKVIGSPKKGVAYFAKSAQVPILPLAVVHHELKGKKAITVRIGKLIPPSKDLDGLSSTLQNTLQELANSIVEDNQSG